MPLRGSCCALVTSNVTPHQRTHEHMGKEYTLSVPVESREAVAAAISQWLQPLLDRIDPKAGEPFPNVFASPTEEGLYLCDNLTDNSVAAQVLLESIDLLLLHAKSVVITEP